MGVYYSTYLGPYIEAKNSREEVTKTRRSCTKRLCILHETSIYDPKVMFCATCGSPIGETTYEKGEPKVCAWEMAEKHDLSCADTSQIGTVPDETDIYTGNKVIKPDRCMSWEARSEKVLEITPQMVADETEKFIKDYATSIVALKKAYGEDNVTVKWGVVQYGS